MGHQNVELLRKGYDAFDRGDMDTIRGVFANDAVAHIPGRSPLAGDYKGIDEIIGVLGKLFELSGGTYKSETHAILADDEHGAVLGSQTAQRDGKRLNSKTVEVYHFGGGKITEFWSLTDDMYAEDEFWS